MPRSQRWAGNRGKSKVTCAGIARIQWRRSTLGGCAVEFLAGSSVALVKGPMDQRRISCPLGVLFNILHLFAHLLDQHLELEGGLGQFGVDRLRSERVGLAMELLRQEIQSLTAAAASCQHAPDLVDMSYQALDFLSDVDLGGE